MDTLWLFSRMKDQQLAQDDGEQRGGDPGSADAFPPDRMVDGGRVCQGLVRGCGWVRGGRLGSACWLRRHGPYLPSSYVAFTFPAC
jgi:hypothetical protein